jgi:alkylation response protein AidB-like acyl-CoA dehydrogenase
MYADIFITAVMTGPPGQHGMSVLLVHKDTPGFSVRKINIRGADLSGLLFSCRNTFVILSAEFSC